MNKNILAIAVGAVGAWLVYEALHRNPLWFYRNTPAPDSIPEWMAAEGRALGGM